MTFSENFSLSSLLKFTSIILFDNLKSLFNIKLIIFNILS